MTDCNKLMVSRGMRGNAVGVFQLPHSGSSFRKYPFGDVESNKITNRFSPSTTCSETSSATNVFVGQSSTTAYRPWSWSIGTCSALTSSA